jgi:apolipoprotein N-acyltransferase
VVGFSDNYNPHPHNCAALVAPDGRTLGVYNKTHLFMGERLAVTAGHETPAFASPLGTVGMEICFDTLYTDVTRGLVRHGAQLIAMPNFDPPTPQGVLHELHSAMLPFRAVENHVPFVRADSNGCSQIINANGRIVGQSPLWQADIRVGDVALGDGRGTFFTRWGDWLPFLCALLAAAAGATSHLAGRLPKRARVRPVRAVLETP